VIEVLRGRIPGLRVVFTFFSPSAEVFSGNFPAEVCAYLPWDLPEVMGSALDAVQPTMIVFTQREVWPTLAHEAAARDVPTVLVAGTLPEGAGRLSWAGRILLAPAFGSLRSVAAVSEEDADRFGRLGVSRECVTVTGDPGIDAARDHVAVIDPNALHMRIFGDHRERDYPRGEHPRDERSRDDDPQGEHAQNGGGPILVAGSTWPSDVDVLLPALARVRESAPGLRIVLVPHEPDGCDFEELGRRLVADGWALARLGEVERIHGPTERAPDAVLVDRVGVLADLYSLAAVAYVGGGFHGDGLHSVLEPAASGVPVLIGPRYHASVHATRLLAVGGARVVTDADVLAHTLLEWLEAPKKKEAHGRRAMDYIEDHLGSAERTADLIARIVPKGTRKGTLSEGET
jgi:3-deoxy-D-manno-octulosonic-acid transferase